MKRKIAFLILSIAFVSIIIISSTYSALFKVDNTEEQQYATGTLAITSSATNNSVTLTNELPVEDSVGENSTPYTFKITNVGNLSFKFDVKFLSTTTSNMINPQYIKIKVNDEPVTTLSALTNGIILSNQTLEPGKSLNVTLRVWLSIDTPNTEIGKVFNAKITTEGHAVYTDEPSLMTLKNLGLDDLLNEESPTTFASTATTDEGIYAAEDDLGTSYYFRGASTRNYVKFGKNSNGSDMYWRIIRINGDGTVRMIYDGTSVRDNGTVTDNASVTTMGFNDNTIDSGYMGYMYGTIGTLTYKELHSNTNDSIIKSYLEDTWYASTIKNTEYEQYIADAIYCNDRSLYSGSGVGREYTIYGAASRISASDSFYEPTLLCKQDNDRFTYNSSNFEIVTNGKLDAPVALITVDEVLMAGVANINEYMNNYLFTGSSFWTMTPYITDSLGPNVYMVNVGSYGGISSIYVNVSHGVRPVISLKANALLYDEATSNGTKEHPFVIDEPPTNDLALETLTYLQSLGFEGEVSETELTTFTTTSKKDGTTGIYKAEDDIGNSYYFRGNITNNYVKYGKYTEDAYADLVEGYSVSYSSTPCETEGWGCFKIASAGDDMYWRIIRINGDGTIRLLYAGTQPYSNGQDPDNGIAGTNERSIGNSAFRYFGNDDNTYVGYMYGEDPSTTYAEAHSNTNNSTIKTTIDNWYLKYMNTNYGGKVADAIYCNDRSVTDETTTGFGSIDTNFGFFDRISGENTAITPTLKCKKLEDRFTRDDSVGGVTGNSKLTYPIALPTVDELVYAGGYIDDSDSGFLDENVINNETYIYDADGFFSMTPFPTIDGFSDIYHSYRGLFYSGDSWYGWYNYSGVRPVISLKADAITSGIGTDINPFIVGS